MIKNNESRYEKKKKLLSERKDDGVEIWIKNTKGVPELILREDPEKTRDYYKSPTTRETITKRVTVLSSINKGVNTEGWNGHTLFGINKKWKRLFYMF